REDLYYRLNVIDINVPPLRDRQGDIAALAEQFLARSAAETNRGVRRLAPAALRRLTEYHWPGNVRELENAIERAVVLSTGDTLGASDFDFLQPRRERSAIAVEGALDETLEQLEQRHIRAVLEACGGNRTQAAERLGIHRETLYNKIRRYGLDDGS
ncbi:MAG TPA: sigma-54-dependent Fis family transcriptional regulator, partial [Armatimonadetes bacterium]|nr:sigma-54-dependent Fis family transcriptional regulator [Armatimonadota bacterium]